MISSNYFGNLTSSILQITILNPKKKTESKKMLDSDFSGLITEIALIGQSIYFFLAMMLSQIMFSVPFNIFRFLLPIPKYID